MKQLCVTLFQKRPKQSRSIKVDTPKNSKGMITTFTTEFERCCCETKTESRQVDVQPSSVKTELSNLHGTCWISSEQRQLNCFNCYSLHLSNNVEQEEKVNLHLKCSIHSQRRDIGGCGTCGIISTWFFKLEFFKTVWETPDQSSSCSCFLRDYNRFNGYITGLETASNNWCIQGFDFLSTVCADSPWKAKPPPTREFGCTCL